MTKQEAWRYYKTWMKEKTYCKALNKEVKITRKGWDHTLFGSNNPNNKSDRRNRLKLFSLAKRAIKFSDELKSVKRGNVIYYEIKYSGVLKNQGKVFKIKVLLKRDIKGNYYLFDVMQV